MNSCWAAAVSSETPLQIDHNSFSLSGPPGALLSTNMAANPGASMAGAESEGAQMPPHILLPIVFASRGNWAPISFPYGKQSPHKDKDRAILDPNYATDKILMVSRGLGSGGRPGLPSP